MSEEQMHAELKKLETVNYILCAVWLFGSIISLCLNFSHNPKDIWLAVITLLCALISYSKFRSAAKFGLAKDMHGSDAPIPRMKKEFSFIFDNKKCIIVKGEKYFIQELKDENNNILIQPLLSELNNEQFIYALLDWAEKVRVINKNYTLSIKIGHKVIGSISPNEVKFHDEVLATDLEALKIWQALAVSQITQK